MKEYRIFCLFATVTWLGLLGPWSCDPDHRFIAHRTERRRLGLLGTTIQATSYKGKDDTISYTVRGYSI